LCYSLHRPLALYASLMGQWRYSLNTDTLPATLQIAQRVYSLAQEQQNSPLMIGACTALGITHFFLGDFEPTQRYLEQGLDLWRSESVPLLAEAVDVPVISCLCYKAECDWHVGRIAECHAPLEQAISLAKEVSDTHALATALCAAASMAHSERKPAEAERRASELIELSTRYRFAHWRAVGAIYGGWARSASGDTAAGVAWIEDGIRDWRATGAVRVMPVWLSLKAEALYLAGCIPEALEAIKKATALSEGSGEREWYSELNRLRGVFLAGIGAEKTEVETAFSEAIRIAKEQKSVSLEKRAERTYAEYRAQKVGALAGKGFRLPLC